MANIRTNDFIIIALGGAAAPLTDEIAVGQKFPNFTDPFAIYPAMSSFDLSRYKGSQAWFKEPRTLTQIQAQASTNIDTHADGIIEIIRKKTGGNFATIGTFCAIGSSNSSLLVLSVAIKLKKLGAPQLTYISVTNATMFPFGRAPVVADVGDMQPANEPDLSGLGWLERPTRLPKRNPSAEMLPPPRVALANSIDSRTLRQFYEVEGNRIRLVSTTPKGKSYDWWWTSEMDGNEVHGEIDGFDNIRFVATEAYDASRHVQICQHDDTMGRARREAEQALSEFPLQN